MAGYDRHKRNVKRMVDGGASEQEIDAYLSGEGVTAAQLRQTSASAPAQATGRIKPEDAMSQDSPEYKARMSELQAEGERFQADSDAAQSKLNVLKPVLGVANFGMRASNAATLGVPKRIASTALEVKDALTGAEDVDRHAQMNSDITRVKQQFPKSSLGADIGGAVAGLGKIASAGGTATRLVPQGMKGAKGLAATTGALAADGAIIAGAQALIDGKDVGDAAQKGGAFGVAANVVTRGAGKALTPLLTKVKGSTSKVEIKRLRDVAYKRVDNMGVNYADDAVASLRQGLSDDLLNPVVSLDKATHPVSSKIYASIQKAKGDISFTKLEQFRKRAARVAANPNGGEDAYAASILSRNIDDFVMSAPASKAGGAEGQKVAAAIKEARELHRRFKGSQSIDDAVGKADLRASSGGSGANSDNATRQNIRQILDNPKRVKYFNDAERKAMEKVVRGSKGGNLARLVGKMAPTGVVSIGGSAVVGGGLPGKTKTRLQGLVCLPRLAQTNQRSMPTALKISQSVKHKDTALSSP